VSLPSSIDIAIIGAGAAGLGAAHALQGSGRSFIVLEARDRVGGRARTIQPHPAVNFDLGCGWLHSGDVNSFVEIGERLGFQIDRTRPPWRDSSNDPGFPTEQRRDFIAALDAFYARAERAAGGQDAPASTCLEPGNCWNPMIDALSTYINGAELDRVSLHDLDAYEDTEVNWRVREGYGALVAAYAASLPIALDTIVTTIDHSSARIRIETARGALDAGQVIVTVPTSMIAQEAIRFVPDLPDKVEASRGLPLGIADKTTLLIDDDTLPKDGSLRAMTMRTAMGTYHLRPFGQPCIEGFFGGRFARELEEAGEGALLSQSVNEIAAVLGNDIRRKLTPLAQSRWALDPFARGSYSHALPGRANERAVLAAPVDGRLFFAGEATSANFFSTAHGARDSGERAAREAMAAMRQVPAQ
jgi:monoamine oxidase